MMDFIISMIMTGVAATIDGLQERISNLCGLLADVCDENTKLRQVERSVPKL